MQVLVSKIEKRSWVEIDIEQLKRNYLLYKSQLPEDFKIIGIIKADGYGHGDIKVAQCLEKLGVHFFAVSNIDEAVGLREAGINGEILILGYTSPYDAKTLVKYDITQAILSDEYANKLRIQGQKVKCHVAIDTGMSRIGLDAKDINKCEESIRSFDTCFNVTGLFTHLSVADSNDKSDIAFTENQIKLFDDVASRVSDLNLQYVHCFNSAAGLHYNYLLSKYVNIDKIVRLGIILYGLHPCDVFDLPNGIAPVLSWKSRVSMVKRVASGNYIGYGRSYETKSDMIIATVPTGYADGYNRLLSNKGFVLIHGKKAQIVGRICMDQLTVDVTGIPNVKMDDTVTLIGKDGSNTITAEEMAQEVGTINYEIVCDISKRVQRFYD